METNKRYNLYGLPKGETRPYMEVLLLTEATLDQCQKVKSIAKKDGYSNIRLAVVDLSTPPDFQNAINL